jgi:uncharacterized protein (TIGR02300 family)
MSKPELGTKRLCAHCGAKFYDLHHSPITCPKCGRVVETAGASPRSNTKAGSEAVPKVEPVLTEIPEARLVSPEDADAETEGEHGLGNGAEDVVEPDEEALNGVALIEESEQEDAGDHIDEENDIEEGK